MDPTRGVHLVLGFALAISFSCLAAEISATADTLLLAMTSNSKRVMQYEWKQRVTVIRKGKPAEPVIDQVHFDSTGNMQRTTISTPPEMSGLKGKIAAGVKENVKEIMEIVARYNKPLQMVEAVKKSQVSQATGGTTLHLDVNDLIDSGDTVTMLVDASTHLANHVEIKTEYDGGPLTISQNYARLPSGGPNVMKEMKVAAPKKELAINVDSYDYTQQTAEESPR
jgi:hypothetical protein